MTYLKKDAATGDDDKDCIRFEQRKTKGQNERLRCTERIQQATNDHPPDTSNYTIAGRPSSQLLTTPIRNYKESAWQRED